MKRWIWVALIVGAIFIIYLIIKDRKSKAKKYELFYSDEPEEVEKITTKERVAEAVGSIASKARIKDCKKQCELSHPFSAKKRNDCICKCS